MARTVRNRSGSPAAFSARRRRRMVASTVRSSTSWSRPHTRSSSWLRENTRPGLSSSWRSRRNSVGLRCTSRPSRVTLWAARSMLRSAKRRTSRGERRPDPAQHRAHARDQLVERERLGDVVVGAHVEAVQAVALLDPRGEHDHRQIRGRRLAAQLAAELEAGHVRQHPVEQDQVRRALGDQRQRLVGVEGLLDREARPLQIVREELLQRGLVLDHQDSAASWPPSPHDPSSACG